MNIVNTVATRDEYAGYPTAYRRRLLLIEHGVPKPEITRGRAETLALHGVPDEGKILLNTGRVVKQKNQDTIIRALPGLPGVRLVIAGGGDLQAAFRKLAGDLGVSDRVHVLGALPHEEAVQLYGAADMFVFPSCNETFGISAVEAVLLGLPTLVSDIAVLREVLHVEGASPVTFLPAEDVGAWREGIARRLAHPTQSEVLNSFGEAIGRKYSKDRMMESYLMLVRARR